MPKFEIHGDDLVYTGGTVGAYFMPDTELWHPFRYFDNGTMDVSEIVTRTPSEAYKIAETIYS